MLPISVGYLLTDILRETDPRSFPEAVVAAQGAATLGPGHGRISLAHPWCPQPECATTPRALKDDRQGTGRRDHPVTSHLNIYADSMHRSLPGASAHQNVRWSSQNHPNPSQLEVHAVPRSPLAGTRQSQGHMGEESTHGSEQSSTACFISYFIVDLFKSTQALAKSPHAHTTRHHQRWIPQDQPTGIPQQLRGNTTSRSEEPLSGCFANSKSSKSFSR